MKLGSPEHANALALIGSDLFDPSGKRRPMKEWVTITVRHSAQWVDFALESIRYIASKEK
jgi:hypothetical protein